MSKRIGTIKRDRHQVLNSHATHSLHVTSYYGGRSRGRCIQLTEGLNHVSLSEAELCFLVKLVKEAGFNLED
jgi:hypothetical protein